MPVRNLWDRLGLLPKRSRATWSAEEFNAILDRERARVHRNACEFSLVVFDVGSTGRARDVEGAINHRVRSTDQVGWLDAQRIGAVLTDTPIEGARKFADDICQSAAASGSPPACSVYTYPSQWLPGGNGRWEGGGSADNSSHPHRDDVLRTSSGEPDRSRKATRTVEAFLGRGLPVWKRLFDIAGSLLGLVVLAPIFLGITVLIKIVSPGPIFFKQERLGYKRKPFTIWKFRTMTTDADASPHKRHFGNLINSEAPMTKLDDVDDPRIFPLGRSLRACCVDELPQLINVFLGTMSLIGPRPCLAYEAEDYLLWHNRRFDSVPGITGLWQATGKARTTFSEMVRLDIRYRQRRSFWLDLGILLRTIPSLLPH